MMINVYDEFEIIQNNLISVHAIHEFLKSYVDNSNGKGPKLIWVFTVLPIVFNKSVVDVIHQKNLSSGSFMRTINEHKDLFVNLQDQMQEMFAKTFKCLNMGSQADLFSYDPQSTSVFLIRSTSILNNRYLSNDYQKILQASKRLGSWFAKASEQELLIYLNISF